MKNKSYFLLSLLLVGITSCNNKPSFQVEGKIADANNKMLYLDEMKMDGAVAMDSVKLDNNGNYSFKGDKPESPNFYRLRLDDKIINFAIDSTETVDINADAKHFSDGYSIGGSDNNEKIKELVLRQINLQDKVDKIAKNKNLPIGVAQDSINSIVSNYKKDVKLNYIFKAPNMTYAYFALFQELNGYMIFDPYANKDDVKCFAAVATSLNNNYPNAARSKNLYNMVIKGMQNTHAPIQKNLEIPNNKIKEAGLIDIKLRDIDGNIHKLTDLKGKVVLLDFTVYNDKNSAAHNLALREIYSKYAESGFEIYQISLDADEHFWMTAADNLPWICVHDDAGAASENIRIYNVQKLPSFFLINKNNELVKRDSNIGNLEAEIKNLL